MRLKPTRSRVALGVAFVAAVAVLAGGSHAHAQERFHLELDRGALIDETALFDLPAVYLFRGDVLRDGAPTDPPAVLNGRIDDDGSFTVPVDGVRWPPMMALWRGADWETRVRIELRRRVTGTFDESTGALDMSMLADLTLNVGGLPSCGVEDFSWELSTASTVSSFAGAPFAEGLDAPGRLVAGWDDWPPITPSPDDPTGACNWLTGRFLGEALNGPGGIMFDRIRLPHLRVAVRPGKRTVERGERARFAATVRNTGNGTATDVYACVAVPREAIMVRPRVPDHLNFNALARCLRVGVMAPGDVQRVEFNPKARARSRRGTYRLGFHAIGDGVASGFHGARMTVK